MRPATVLHLGKYYPPERGGIETVLEALCVGADATVAPRALVLSTGRRTLHEVIARIPVTRVGSVATIGAVSVAPMLPVWLRRATADVIVLHEPNPMALVACVLARPSAPLVVWFHSEVIRPHWKYQLFYRPFLDWVLARAARVVVAAPPMRDVPALAAVRDKVVVIPYGLDPTPYGSIASPAPEVGERRQPTLLFVGRLVAYKGVDVLLRAMVGVPASLVLVGDGPLRRTLEALAQDLGVTDRVQFLGRVTDAERLDWYGRADAVVLPSVSRQEAFGMVQVEAMLSGRPVVSTSLPTGVPWVNRHLQTGIVVPPGDVDALRGALVRLSTDQDERTRLGRAARAHALEQFTAARMCATFDALCRSVAGETAVAPQSQPARVG